MAGYFFQSSQRPTCLSGVVGLTACLLLAGCALPDYHLPGGFSSTYYRALQQSEYERMAAQSPPMLPPSVVTEPVLSSAAPAGVSAAANPSGIGAANSSAGSAATPTPPAVSSGWREWVRGIRPGRPPATANDSANDLMEPESAIPAPSAGQARSGLLGSSTRLAP